MMDSTLQERYDCNTAIMHARTAVMNRYADALAAIGEISAQTDALKAVDLHACLRIINDIVKRVQAGGTVITKGQRIRIKNNLGEVLKELEFDEGIPESFQARYAGTEQIAHAIWTEEPGTQQYVTVDLCCEIPIQCCEPL